MMGLVVARLALSVAMALVLGAPGHAEDVSARKMQVKDNADVSRQRVGFLSVDPLIDVTDGYAGATTGGVSLHVFGATTANDVCLRVAPSDCQVTGAAADVLRCTSADRSAKILVKPGKAKAKFKGGIGFELDALANQLPVTMVLRAGAAGYCAVCDGGTDVVAKDGTDGKQVLAKTCNPVPCPFEASPCGPFPRPADPVVMTGIQVGAPVLGTLPDNVVAFRWSGGWRQIPVQIDERANVNFDDVYNGLGNNGMGGGIFCGTTCGGGFTRLDYTDGGTFTGLDPDPMFDANDELVVMGSDAGGQATTITEPPGTLVGTGREVIVTDPTGPGVGYVYLFQQDGSLFPHAGQQYVGYQFNLNSGAYLTTYNVLDGPNPENSTVGSAVYERHFSDRWVQDELALFAGGATGVDILDRHKTQVAGCTRTEDTFIADEGAFVVNRDGPVRALRSYVGANSGPLTQRQHAFYRSREDNTTFIRVHAIPAARDLIDYAPAATNMTLYDNNNLGGVTIDGVPDTYTTGALDWQLVTGVQGSITMVPLLTTDVPGFTATSIYEDDNLTPVGPLCTGDAAAYGASGLRLQDADGGLPNTDPTFSPFNVVTATRIIYYDRPGLLPVDAALRRTWALNPPTVVTAPWP